MSATPSSPSELPTEKRLRQALLDMEVPLLEIRSFIRMLDRMATSRHRIEADELAHLEDHLERLHDQVWDLWQRAFHAARELSPTPKLAEASEGKFRTALAELAQIWREQQMDDVIVAGRARGH